MHLADSVSAFTVTQLSPSVLRLEVDVTAGTLTRKATLFWSPPA
jgi:hypothetical protein